MPSFALPLRVALLGMLLAPLGLGACASGSDIKPSPIPANALASGRGANPTTPTAITTEARGTRLDQLLAVVEGRPLTTRMMVRRLGLAPEEIGDPDNQVEIARETRSWAKEQLYEKAAERIGLKLPPGRVDKFAEERLGQELAKASKEVGRPVSRAEFLQTEKLTWPEFREKQRGIIVRELYVRKMLTGIGQGTRPQVDMVVSPAEVRRIYRANPGMFDEKAGVRLVQFSIPFERYETEGREFVEVDRLAAAEASRLAADFKAGMTSEALAAKYRLGKQGERWAEAREGQFVSQAPDPEITAWMLDPTRVRGDTRVQPNLAGIQVIGVLESRRARRVPFQEAYPEIVKELSFARQAQLEARTTIDLLSKGDVVWPDALSDALMEEARAVLGKIQELPHLRGARLR